MRHYGRRRWLSAQVALLAQIPLSAQVAVGAGGLLAPIAL